MSRYLSAANQFGLNVDALPWAQAGNYTRKSAVPAGPGREQVSELMPFPGAKPRERFHDCPSRRGCGQATAGQRLPKLVALRRCQRCRCLVKLLVARVCSRKLKDQVVPLPNTTFQDKVRELHRYCPRVAYFAITTRTSERSVSTP